ncbi:MAG: hypothetical protein WBB45_16045 [Cyclobacteriaceae bacterium]
MDRRKTDGGRASASISGAPTKSPYDPQQYGTSSMCLQRGQAQTVAIACKS